MNSFRENMLNHVKKKHSCTQVWKITRCPEDKSPKETWSMPNIIYQSLLFYAALLGKWTLVHGIDPSTVEYSRGPIFSQRNHFDFRGQTVLPANSSDPSNTAEESAGSGSNHQIGNDRNRKIRSNSGMPRTRHLQGRCQTPKLIRNPSDSTLTKQALPHRSNGNGDDFCSKRSHTSYHRCQVAHPLRNGT